jgi:hypothetical protein
VFLANGCAGCHTITSLEGATGAYGPNLDSVGIKGVVYIRESIIDPGAVTAEQCPGGPCSAGLMPTFFGFILLPEELDAVVAYLGTMTAPIAIPPSSTATPTTPPAATATPASPANTPTPQPAATPTLAPTPTPSGSTTTGTVTLDPNIDNTRYESASPASSGAGSFLYAGETSRNGSRRALLRFDVASTVPAGATVTSVTLALSVSRAQGTGTPMTVHRVTASWGEGASNAGSPGGAGTSASTGDATWTSRFFDGDAWAAPGGDFVTPASATASVGRSGTATWVTTAELVADVQAWLSAPADNFGWIIVGNESASRTAKRFHSREGSAANRPSLTIVYTTAG